MTSLHEKMELLSEMVAFALVDGELHEEEIIFLTTIAETLEISKEQYFSLFTKAYEPIIVKDPFTRIIHFYKLAMLMYCDNRLHVNEKIAINHIGVRLGLSFDAMNVITVMVANAKDETLPIESLVSVYQLQHN